MAGQSWPIIASPLGRAAASAQLIAAQLHHPVLSFDQRLMEVSLGQWEQRHLDELLAHKPPALNSREYYLTAPGAESLLQVQQRLLAWLGDANTPARCIVVSHGLTGMILRALLLQLSAEQLWQQDVPQDAYYYLNGGHIERIDVGLSPKR